jgi:hypothetical protein
MAKKREPDNLALDMIQCKKDGYGIHYGAWYAAQNRPLKIETVEGMPKGWQRCKWCNRIYKPTKKGRQLYCDISCQKAAQNARSREMKEASRREQDGQ